MRSQLTSRLAMVGADETSRANCFAGGRVLVGSNRAPQPRSYQQVVRTMQPSGIDNSEFQSDTSEAQTTKTNTIEIVSRIGYATWRLTATGACFRVCEIDPSVAHAHTRGRILLSPESDESESLQMLFVSIRWHIGFRVYRCDICNRPASALPYRGCQKGADVAGIWSAEYDCHRLTGIAGSCRTLAPGLDHQSQACLATVACGGESSCSGPPTQDTG